MKIGFVGLGKLGLPCAVAMATKHDVMGYDINSANMNKEPKPYREAGFTEGSDFNHELSVSSIKFGSLARVCVHAEVLFVAVQTPHDPEFEGITPLPESRRDFDYSYLIDAVKSIVECGYNGVVVVISTVLPGTMRREIVPLLRGQSLVYNPYFIAMGTTIPDFLEPEIVLMGSDSKIAIKTVAQVYSHFGLVRGVHHRMSIESAELTKVAYNTFISWKIGITNTLMEICHKVPGASIDDVMYVLKSSDYRITSSMYMTGGMGDGGGCHPRDNIAMSWLSRELDLGHDIFESAMVAREAQAKWLALLMLEESVKHNLPVAIEGYAFKPNTNLTVGSHALLVREFIRKASVHDKLVDQTTLCHPAVVLIGCAHDYIRDKQWPAGSVIIDPFRMYKDVPGCKYIPLGVG